MKKFYTIVLSLFIIVGTAVLSHYIFSDDLNMYEKILAALFLYAFIRSSTGILNRVVVLEGDNFNMALNIIKNKKYLTVFLLADIYSQMDLIGIEKKATVLDTMLSRPDLLAKMSNEHSFESIDMIVDKLDNDEVFNDILLSDWSYGIDTFLADLKSDKEK